MIILYQLLKVTRTRQTQKQQQNEHVAFVIFKFLFVIWIQSRSNLMHLNQLETKSKTK